MRLLPGAQRPANNRMQRTDASASKLAPASAADAAARSAETMSGEDLNDDSL
jgi:hypothetical protein